jgi:hypothetical protein
MKQIVALAALACLLAAGSSDAQVVKQEPFDGQMVPGALFWWTTALAAKARSKR